MPTGASDILWAVETSSRKWAHGARGRGVPLLPPIGAAGGGSRAHAAGTPAALLSHGLPSTAGGQAQAAGSRQPVLETAAAEQHLAALGAGSMTQVGFDLIGRDAETGHLRDLSC
jgi:hypothetical protein